MTRIVISNTAQELDTHLQKVIRSTDSFQSETPTQVNTLNTVSCLVTADVTVVDEQEISGQPVDKFQLLSITYNTQKYEPTFLGGMSPVSSFKSNDCGGVRNGQTERLLVAETDDVAGYKVGDTFNIGDTKQHINGFQFSQDFENWILGGMSLSAVQHRDDLPIEVLADPVQKDGQQLADGGTVYTLQDVIKYDQAWKQASGE